MCCACVVRCVLFCFGVCCSMLLRFVYPGFASFCSVSLHAVMFHVLVLVRVDALRSVSVHFYLCWVTLPSFNLLSCVVVPLVVLCFVLHWVALQCLVSGTSVCVALLLVASLRFALLLSLRVALLSFHFMNLTSSISQRLQEEHWGNQPGEIARDSSSNQCLRLWRKLTYC